MEKTLHNTDTNTTQSNVSDVKFWGDSGLFKLLSKASSKQEGWMKSTKAMQINGVGCVVQVTTQQRNIDGTNSCAEALTFVPGAVIETNSPDPDGVTSRRLVRI